MMLKMMVSLAFLLIGTRVEAQDRWQLIDGTTGQQGHATAYVDTTTIQVVRDHITLWLKMQWDHPVQMKTSQFNTALSLQEVDCTARRYRSRSIVWMHDGAIVLRNNSATEWIDIPPDSIAELLLDFCPTGAAP